jgi:hypothetical protein
MFWKPKVWALTAAVIYPLVWAALVTPFVIHKNFDTLFTLVMLSSPSSLASGSVASSVQGAFNLGRDAETIIEISGFLIFGMAQFALIGYVLGLVLRTLRNGISAAFSCGKTS